MTDAVITTVIDDIVDAIRALPWRSNVCPSDSDASPPPVPYDVDVQVTYSGFAELARTSSLVLEQAIVDLNITSVIDVPVDDHTPRAETINLAQSRSQLIRDTITNFYKPYARVENILMQSPMDSALALKGTFNQRISLDLDVLRTIEGSSSTSPTVTDTGDSIPVLTKTRNAVWDAIDNWPAFAADGDRPAAWNRKFKTDEDLEELSLHDPAVAELPAIAVTWGPVEPKWWVNTMQQWNQQLIITFWLPANWQAVAEWRQSQLMQALYQCAPEDRPNVSYVRGATGRLPTKSPLSLELVAIGRSQKVHAWQGQISLTLPINFDPNA